MWVNGASYESYIGRWSRLVARQFLNWLDVSSGAQWLDVGCGTGILSQTILDIASPQMVVGVEPSEEYIEFARTHTAFGIICKCTCHNRASGTG
ncbi:MAG: class I SAM-dependent methyltransferase [Nitrososphaeraceae archaeon]